MLTWLERFWFFVLNCIPSYRQTKSMERWLEAGRAVDNWIAVNDIPLNYSEAGRSLVRDHIAAYLNFVRHHAWITFDVDYIAMWSAHLKPAPFSPSPASPLCPQ